MSEAAHVTLAVFKLIAKGDEKHFGLSDWIRGTREHPVLLEFLDLKQEGLEEAFKILDRKNRDKVDIQDLEKYLQNIHKCSNTAFSEWLSDVHGDKNLEGVRQELEDELRAKIEVVQKQLHETKYALDKITPMC